MRYLTPKNRAILREMVTTDFKIRYQGSTLGYLWTLLRPLFMFIVLYTVFTVVFKAGRDIPNYPIYLFMGIMLWGFFSEMTQSALRVVVERGDLVSKIKISRWLLVVSASVSALINLGFNMIILMVFVFMSGMDLLMTSLWLPVFIFEVYIFALGISLLLSALYVKFRDVAYIWDVVLQAGFYATPILYSIALVSSEGLRQIMLSNPMAQAIQGAREVFVTNQAVTTSEVFGTNWAILIPLAIVGVVLVTGILYFRKESKYFAENL